MNEHLTMDHCEIVDRNYRNGRFVEFCQDEQFKIKNTPTVTEKVIGSNLSGS